MIKCGYNDNTDLLPTTMLVAKIYFEIIKKNASEGVFELFVKAVSIAKTKKELRTKKSERRKLQKPEFFIIVTNKN